MIPLSVKMKGWMRYRDEQTADFEGGSLISICGENGAGKSSIFDAITFALYGQSRMKKQRVDELISQGMELASVDFEFAQGNERYLVHRQASTKAGAGKRSLHVWDAAVNDWARVPGTEKEDALDRTIGNIVRLSYEAFTSSFMLQQGTATQFIDSDPKDRFAIISSLIGLKEYEAIEKRAREAHRDAQTLLKKTAEDLNALGDVDPDNAARLQSELETATAHEAAALAAQQAAQAMLADARRFARLAAEVALLDAQLADARTRVDQKEKIEDQAAAFEAIARGIETLRRIRGALTDATRAASAAKAAAQRAAKIDIDAMTAAATDADTRAKQAAKQLDKLEREFAMAQKVERAAHDFATLAASILEGRAHIADFDARVAECDGLLRTLSARTGDLERDGKAAEAAAEAADAALDTARREAADSTARAETLAAQLAERKAAAKESTCARCGQKIDKAAAKKQVDALSAALTAITAAAKKTSAAATSAERARAAARKQHQSAVAAVTKAVQEAHRIEADYTAVRTQREATATALASQESGLDGRLKDVGSARDVHAKAAERCEAAEAERDAARNALDAARDEHEAARTALDAAREQQSALDAEAQTQSATAEGHRRTAEAMSQGLGALQPQALDDPDGLMTILRAQERDLAGAPERKQALDRTIADATAWSAQRTAKHEEIEAIPDAHRLNEIDALDRARCADETAGAARAHRDELQRALAMLEARIEDVCRLRSEKERLDLRHKRLKKLIDLLGKKGLQGLLVHDALFNIKNEANAFLGRLTGGSLRLEIENTGKGDELELKALDSTCMTEPRSAKVLSGSQKFRCAVAIASGIGQYAGAGGMRSIVIDEGFGSLDDAGQQLMVDELKQLTTHMDKVIVVSHLAAFADRNHFPDQLLVRTSGDASHISRLA